MFAMVPISRLECYVILLYLVTVR